MKINGRFGVNCLTLSRVAVIPAVLLLDRRGATLAGFLLMVWIDASDFLDGAFARTFKCQSFCGAVLDAGADFLVLIALCLYGVFGALSPALAGLMTVSFGLYLLNSLSENGLAKTRVGMYSGTLLYAAVTGLFAQRGLAPGLAVPAAFAAGLPCAGILMAAVIENALALSRRSRIRRLDHPRIHRFGIREDSRYSGG
jgi:phosphatidylglycerophosphate synthase